jgi:hypothetical protein
MNLDRYTSFTSDFKDYVFFSEGPNGRVKKVVRFTKIQNNPEVYNLGYGDEKPGQGEIDDLIVTDNGDRDLLLATVANTIIEFSNHFGNHYIYVTGSTPARTRLYQIAISPLLNEISADFELYGVKNGVLQKFKRNVNYDAFLVKRK